MSAGGDRGGAGAVFDRVFRNPDTGKLAIAQFPNLPLAIYLVAAAGRWLFEPTGGVGTAVDVVAAGALLWWSVWEIGWGDSLFRRGLGAVVLVGLLVDVLLG